MLITQVDLNWALQMWYYLQEHLSLKNNNIEKLYGAVTSLPCLRSLNVRHNKLQKTGVPKDLFQMDDLTTLDFSHNKLTEIPEGLEEAKSLLVLNLSDNMWDDTD